MISNKKVVNYKVLDLVEIYNIDIKFVFVGVEVEAQVGMEVVPIGFAPEHSRQDLLIRLARGRRGKTRTVPRG
jgi:hypothetical protein